MSLVLLTSPPTGGGNLNLVSRAEENTSNKKIEIFYGWFKLTPTLRIFTDFEQFSHGSEHEDAGIKLVLHWFMTFYDK